MTGMKFYRGTLEETQKYSFQGQVPETKLCACGGTALLIGTIDDKHGELCREQKQRLANGAQYWPHDSCSIFVYLCGDCLAPSGFLTQA